MLARDNDEPERRAIQLDRAGCDRTVRNKGGDTGRDHAERQGNTAVVERLNRLDPRCALVEAAKVGDREELSRLIDSACDILAFGGVTLAKV